MTEVKWRSWVVRCEAVRSSASQMRGREACLRCADLATGSPGPLRPGRAVQGATAALSAQASVTPGTRKTLARLEGWLAESDFLCASIGSLFEGCLWLRPSKSGSRARLPPNPCRGRCDLKSPGHLASTRQSSRAGEGTKGGGRWTASSSTDSFHLLSRT